MSRRKIKPILWRTTNRPVPCYFLGTLHIADTWYNVVPKSLIKTFDSCEVLCVELNIEKTSAAQSTKAANELKRSVSKEVLDKIVNQAKTTKRRIKRISNQTATNIMLAGLDGLLLERATESNKKIISLETFQEQMESMRIIHPEIKNIPEVNPVDYIRSAFMTGDTELFQTMTNDIWGPRASNWCARHVRMTSRLMNHLRAIPDKSFFVAIGAMHLVSPANILDLLKLCGVETERVQ